MSMMSWSFRDPNDRGPGRGKGRGGQGGEVLGEARADPWILPERPEAFGWSRECFKFESKIIKIRFRNAQNQPTKLGIHNRKPIIWAPRGFWEARFQMGRDVVVLHRNLFQKTYYVVLNCSKSPQAWGWSETDHPHRRLMGSLLCGFWQDPGCVRGLVGQLSKDRSGLVGCVGWWFPSRPQRPTMVQSLGVWEAIWVDFGPRTFSFEP